MQLFSRYIDKILWLFPGVSWKLVTLVNYFVKNSFIDVPQGPKYLFLFQDTVGKKLIWSNESITPHISILYFTYLNDTIDKKNFVEIN